MPGLPDFQQVAGVPSTAPRQSTLVVPKSHPPIQQACHHEHEATHQAVCQSLKEQLQLLLPLFGLPPCPGLTLALPQNVIVLSALII